MGKECMRRGGKDSDGCYDGMKYGALLDMKRNDAMRYDAWN